MARKISISFKKTKKDIELYEYLMSLDDKSADIKNILRNAYKDKMINAAGKKKENKSEVDVFNF